MLLWVYPGKCLCVQLFKPLHKTRFEAFRPVKHVLSFALSSLSLACVRIVIQYFDSAETTTTWHTNICNKYYTEIWVCKASSEKSRFKFVNQSMKSLQLWLIPTVIKRDWTRCRLSVVSSITSNQNDDDDNGDDEENCEKSHADNSRHQGQLRFLFRGCLVSETWSLQPRI